MMQQADCQNEVSLKSRNEVIYRLSEGGSTEISV